MMLPALSTLCCLISRRFLLAIGVQEMNSMDSRIVDWFHSREKLQHTYRDFLAVSISCTKTLKSSYCLYPENARRMKNNKMYIQIQTFFNETFFNNGFQFSEFTLIFPVTVIYSRTSIMASTLSYFNKLKLKCCRLIEKQN